ncbi:MAG: GNAT family N-acetyltransferase, partial [Gemmatimonadetes bacterium]|nr:GNAT family N-acetyltransferase [Gemmatimonadota bacterium]NIU74147.1 GNAT family N-acetyltransferase [Gammaproteobacteria bacterium]NIP79271.1 GNAT family N-acetyltransferase [Gemmatimonadota bacterium]NIQ53966.1 GNAT family N-acetyltransferase [Gemmatimonadota bacterium]NIW38865.1 GNAT family N-acetyltransferase [Gemmatimonadota bacterium]
MFESNVPEDFRAEEREEFQAFLERLPGPYLVLEGDDGAVIGCG